MVRERRRQYILVSCCDIYVIRTQMGRSFDGRLYIENAIYFAALTTRQHAPIVVQAINA